MRTVTTVAELRAALAPARAAGHAVALVPTMGALHDGHLALVRRARELAGEVVVSLFVNPTQFEDPADLARYPRDAEADAALLRAEGVDVLYAPPAAEVYPPGFATRVVVSGITEVLEGAHRGPAHFDGIATIVLKLLNAARPDVVLFGQKDAQQVLVVRRMVSDLDMPVEVEVVPTVREPDGLALSSRNARLSPSERERARALPEALRAATAAPDLPAAERAARAALAARDVQPEYLVFVDPDALTPLADPGEEALVAVAACVGPVRLIDNALIHRDGRPS